MDGDARRHDSSATRGLPDDQVEASAEDLSDPPPVQSSNLVERELEDALRLIPQALASTARATMATNVDLFPLSLGELQDTNFDFSPDFELFHDSDREYIQLPDHLSPIDPALQCRNNLNHLPLPHQAALAMPLSPPHDPLLQAQHGVHSGSGAEVSPVPREQFTSAQYDDKGYDNSNGVVMGMAVGKTVATTDDRGSSHAPAMSMSDHGSTVVNDEDGKAQELCSRFSESNFAACVRSSQDICVGTAVSSAQPASCSPPPVSNRAENAYQKPVASKTSSSRRSKQSAPSKRPRQPRSNTPSTKPSPPIKIAPRSAALPPSQNVTSGPVFSSSMQSPTTTIEMSRFPAHSLAMHQRQTATVEELQKNAPHPHTVPSTQPATVRSSSNPHVAMTAPQTTSVDADKVSKPLLLNSQFPHSQQSGVPAPTMQQLQLPVSHMPMGMNGNIGNLLPVISNIFPVHPMMFSPANTPPPHAPNPTTLVDKNKQRLTPKDLQPPGQQLGVSTSMSHAQPSTSASLPATNSGELENPQLEKLNPSQAQTSMHQPMAGSQPAQAFLASDMLSMMPPFMFDPTVYFRMAQQFAFQQRMMGPLPSSVNLSPPPSSTENQNTATNITVSPFVGPTNNETPAEGVATNSDQQNIAHNISPDVAVAHSSAVEANLKPGNGSSGSVGASVSADLGTPVVNRPVTMSADGIQRELPRQPAARLDRHPVLGRLQLSNAVRATIKGTSKYNGAADGIGSSQGSSASLEPIRPNAQRGGLPGPPTSAICLNKGEKIIKPLSSSAAPLGNTAKAGDSRIQKKRLVWTPELHERFVKAIDVVGLTQAVPKTLVTIMNVDGLTTEHVKSHLQKYRNSLRKEADEEARVNVQNGSKKSASVQFSTEAKPSDANDVIDSNQKDEKLSGLDNEVAMIVDPPPPTTKSESSKAANSKGELSPTGRWPSMPNSLRPEQIADPIHAIEIGNDDNNGRLQKRVSVDETSSDSLQNNMALRDNEVNDGAGGAVLSVPTGMKVTGDGSTILKTNDDNCKDAEGSHDHIQRDLELELVKEKTLQLQLQLQMMVHRTISLERKLQQEHENKKSNAPIEQEESERSGRSAVGMLDYSSGNMKENIEKTELEKDECDENADDADEVQVRHEETSRTKRKIESMNSVESYEIDPLFSVVDAQHNDVGQIFNSSDVHGQDAGSFSQQVDHKRQRKSEHRMTGDEELAELKSQQLEMRKQLELTTALLDVRLRDAASSAVNVTKRATQKT